MGKVLALHTGHSGSIPNTPRTTKSNSLTQSLSKCDPKQTKVCLASTVLVSGLHLNRWEWVVAVHEAVLGVPQDSVPRSCVSSSDWFALVLLLCVWETCSNMVHVEWSFLHSWLTAGLTMGSLMGWWVQGDPELLVSAQADTSFNVHANRVQDNLSD